VLEGHSPIFDFSLKSERRLMITGIGSGEAFAG
jgi:hypothetical protein